jgi:hypothetical protein
MKGLTSEAIIAELVKKPDRPWADWKSGKAITPKALAGLLKPFGIFSHQLSVGDGKELRGYARHALENAFSATYPSSMCRCVGNSTAADTSSSFQYVGEPSYRRIEKARKMTGAVAGPTHRHIETAQRTGKENCRRKEVIRPAPGDSLDNFK